MRLLIAFACICLGFHASAQDSLSEALVRASAGTLAPLQMPDGTRLWRFAGKQMKGEDADMRMTDLIAQALGKAQWCSNGWEIVNRSEPTKGFLLIEGRCK